MCEIVRMSAHVQRRAAKTGSHSQTSITLGGEIASLPGEPMPGCRFHRDQPVTADGGDALFLGLVYPEAGEPFARLWPVEGGGNRFVRLSRVEAMP